MEDSQRGPADFILFGLAFVGFVLGTGGLITTSVPAAVTGVVLMLLSVCSFMLKSALQ